MKNSKFKQFLDNYRIYRLRTNKHNAMYEKGDFKYALFGFVVCLVPALICFGLFGWFLMRYV